MTFKQCLGPAALSCLLLSLATPPRAAAPPDALVAPMNAARVIQVLDQTIDWYRLIGLQQQAATAPSDLLILYDNRQTANKVVALAFDIARADADLLVSQPTPVKQPTEHETSPQVLVQLQDKLAAQSATVQAELEAQQQKLTAGGSKKSRDDVDAKIAELHGELELIATKQSIVVTMMGFSTGAGGAGDAATGLKGHIDAMAVAIPSATAVAAAAGGSPPGGNPAPGPAAVGSGAGTAATGLLPGLDLASVPSAVRFGLWDLASAAFKLSEKAGTMQSIDRRTVALQATLAQTRAPLVEQLKILSARGDALAAQADTADAATLKTVRAQLDALATLFKESSGLLIPLSKEEVLLEQYRRNLANWQSAIEGQTHDALRTLGIRVAALAVVLALLVGAAELWRRAVIRYVHDSRRRSQLLLLRRIAFWFVVAIVVGVAFASELGSIVTFAGLITAGVAVAMQSVLVSIVGYFFLIGKYGIRVGDRVQIGEVAGEVIDLGLVRLYLMELGAKGAAGPTGRVVAFANSVVFQVASGLFKQIPGVNFSWREVTLTLPPGADYGSIKERLSRAVSDALEEYRPEILRQTKEIQRTTMSDAAGDALPEVQLRFAATGVEARVRYPVQLRYAADIEERVTEALTKVMISLPALSAPTAPSG